MWFRVAQTIDKKASKHLYCLLHKDLIGYDINHGYVTDEYNQKKKKIGKSLAITVR